LSERHDDLAALRRAFAALPAVPPDPAACPASERLLAAVAGELPPAALRDLVAHVAACPACAEDWRLAIALENPADEAPEAAAGEARSRRAPRRATLWWAAAAASVLLAVGLFPRLYPRPEATLRGIQAGPALSAPEILPRESCVLHWSAIRGATYDLDVYVEHSRPVEQATRLTVTHHQIPSARLAGIPAGTGITWRVTANLPDGRRLTSHLGSFVLR
jgi:hypothetical protein